jgi:hypothetical protein
MRSGFQAVSVPRCRFRCAYVTAAVTALCLLSMPLNAKQDPPSKTIELVDITTAPGVQLPAEYLSALQDQLLADLTSSKQFVNVTRTVAGQTTHPNFILSCVVTEFTPGSRAKRILSTGFGRMVAVGATRMTVHTTLTDETNHTTVLDDNVSAAQKGTGTLNPLASMSGSKSIAGLQAKKIVDRVKASLHGK